MKDMLKITKDQIKQTILEDPVLSPDDEVHQFVSAEFDKIDSDHVSILTNILDKFEGKDVIKGILLYGIFIGINIGIDMESDMDEEDDFETDICTCGCVTTH